MRRLHPWFMLSRVYSLERKFEGDAASRIGELALRVPSKEELVQLAVEIPDQMSVDFVESATGRGDLCVAAFHHDRIVGFVWGSTHGAPHRDGLWARVDPPFFYGYKSYVHPNYRGKNLSAHLISFRDAIFRDRGFRSHIGFVETHNYPSLRLNRYLGSRFLGYAGYINLFGRLYPFRTPGVSRYSFRFSRPDDSPAGIDRT